MNRATLSIAFLGAILVWPALAYWLSHNWMDRPEESVFLFAALPSLVLAPFAFLDVVSENFTLLTSLLALTAWTMALRFFFKRSRERFARFTLLAITSVISLGQALLGMLMIAGKNC